MKGFFLALMSGLSGALFAQAYKLRTRLGYRPVPVIVSFTIWFCCLSALLAMILRAWRYSLPLLILGIAFGISFLTSICLYMRVCEKTRLNISWTIVQISVVLPFGLSIIVFAEHPDPISWVGIVLIGLAICVFAAARWKQGEQADGGDWRTLGMLITSSILTGLNLFVPKILYRVDPGGTIFSLLPYAGISLLPYAGISLLPAALVLAVVSLSPNTVNISRSAGKAWGLVLLSGYMVVTTSGATVFVYYALKILAGSIVYPVRNVACVVIAALLSAVLFRERAAKLELLGIGISLCGIALISAAL